MTTNYLADELRQIIADLVTPGTGRELAHERLQRLTEYVERFAEPITGELDTLATGLDAEQEIRARAAAISISAMQAACRVLGLDPDEVRAVTLTPAGMCVERYLRNENGAMFVVRRGWLRRRMPATERVVYAVRDDDPKPAMAGRAVDPHHAIRADGITVAVVPCTADCPPEHHRRLSDG